MILRNEKKRHKYKRPGSERLYDLWEIVMFTNKTFNKDNLSTMNKILCIYLIGVLIGNSNNNGTVEPQ